MKPDKNAFFVNNFDLVRLIAASQVMVFHAFSNFTDPVPGFAVAIDYMPGVPAFFFVSGFLISASYERKPQLRYFAVNRALRIFPALYGVLAFSLLTLFLYFDTEILADNAGELVLWCLAQVTFLQSWNPDFLRTYGIGVVNGSLWTIPVELSFYIATPIIYVLGRKLGRPATVFVGILVLSFLIQYYLYGNRDDLPRLIFKALTVSPIPWIGMFCMGILTQRNFPVLYPYVAGKFLFYALLYAVAATISHYYDFYPLLSGSGNALGAINYVLLCLLIMSAAYTKPELASRVLHRNDISYGVYIFHAPVINVLYHNGLSGADAVFWTITASLALGTLSWFAIEKPALSLKRWALYRHE